MKIKDYKCKCGENDFFFDDKGNQKGIYCSYCGRWLKWASKDEQNLTIEQESCDNAISRQAVLDLFNKSDEYSWEMSLIRKKIEEMPPVTPQPKTGQRCKDG